MSRKPSIKPSMEHVYVYRCIGDKLGMPERRRRPKSEPGPVPAVERPLRAMSYKQMAKVLGLAPSTVTACVKSVEEAVFGESRSTGDDGGSAVGVGEGLFRAAGRSGQKTFTEAGEERYWKAVELLELHQAFGAKLPTQREFVAIGSFNALLSSYLPLALKPFLTPEKRQDRPLLRLYDLELPEIFEAVSSRRVHFAIGSVPSPRDKALADATVEVTPLGFEIGRGLLVHPDHPLAAKASIEAADLAREVVLRFPSRMTTPGLETWLTPDYEGGGDIVEVRTFGEMLQFVKLNVGVAVVADIPSEMQDALELKKVVFKPLPDVGSAIVAAYLPRNEELSAGAKRVYEGIVEFFRGLKAEQAKPTGRRKR